MDRARPMAARLKSARRRRVFSPAGITKHLMAGPAGNSEFCFPSTSRFPSASPRGNIEGLRETKLTVSLPLGPVIKCILIN